MNSLIVVTARMLEQLPLYGNWLLVLY